MTPQTPIRTRIKESLIANLGLDGLTPEQISDHTPLFGDAVEGGLGLDSIDALEMMVVFEKEFGITIDIEKVDLEALATVASLESFLLGFAGTAAPRT
jgi:acyl carrier protein